MITLCGRKSIDGDFSYISIAKKYTEKYFIFKKKKNNICSQIFRYFITENFRSILFYSKYFVLKKKRIMIKKKTLFAKDINNKGATQQHNNKKNQELKSSQYVNTLDITCLSGRKSMDEVFLHVLIAKKYS